MQVRVDGLLHAADACTMPTFSEHGFEHSNGRSYTLSAESPDQPIAQAVEPGCRFDIESGKAFGSARDTIIRTHATCQKQPGQAHEKAAQARGYKATAQARGTHLPALQEADGDQGRPHRPECRRVLGVRGVSEMPGDSADLSLGVRPVRPPQYSKTLNQLMPANSSRAMRRCSSSDSSITCCRISRADSRSPSSIST